MGGWRPGSGRPKGVRDSFKRRKAPKGVLPTEIITKAKRELLALGPDGRDMDEIGILRSVGMATIGLYCRELEQDGLEANERRKTLVHAFEVIHRAQLDAIKAFGAHVRSIQAQELPTLSAHTNTITEPQLQDWRARIQEDS